MGTRTPPSPPDVTSSPLASFRSILDQASIGLYCTTAEGKILLANTAMAQMLGYDSFEQLAGRDLSQEGYEAGYPRSAFLEQIERDGSVVDLESAWHRRDGTVLHILESARAVRDDERRTLYYEGIAQDVTQQREAEAALRQTAGDLQSLMDNVPGFIIKLDRNGRIVFTNRFYEGLTKEQVIGTPLLDWLPEELHKQCRTLIDRAFETGEAGSIEVWAPDSGGDVRWYSARVGPINVDGEITAAILIAPDITHLKRHETAREESCAEIERHRRQVRQTERRRLAIERLAVLGQMAAGVAHEINNPLGAIHNSVFLLKKSVAPDHPNHQFLGIIQSEIDRITEVVTHLSDLQTPLTPRSQPADLNAILGNVLRLVTARMQRIGVTLRDERSAGLPWGDLPISQVTQILWNPILNALHAMKQVQRRELTIRTGHDDRRIHVDIEDTGCGISREDLPRVFDPFVSTRRSAPDGEVGMGLGLSITRNVIESMGGVISIRSELGRGTSLRLSFPREPVATGSES